MDLFWVISIGCIIYLILVWLIRKLTINKLNERHVFITGCDSGFGKLLALRLDKMGLNVFAACLTETGEDGLRKKASPRLVTLSLDVTNENSIEKAVDFVKSKLPFGKGLWCLVNNAGIAGAVGLTTWLRKEDYEKTLAVNLFGVTETTRIFLPLVRKGRGRVVNMASILGTVSLPGAAPYCISKHGVEVFSDCLRGENCRHGITVHIIEPGYFDTGIATTESVTEAMTKTFNKLDPQTKQYYGADYMSRVDLNTFLEKVTSKDVYKVVDAYVHAVTSRFPKYRYRVGWDAATLFRFVRWGPEWLVDMVLGVNLPLPQELL